MCNIGYFHVTVCTHNFVYIMKIRNLELDDMVKEQSQIVSNRLKELRDKNQVTQNEIATQLGITRKTYILYENSRRSMSSEILLKLSDLFHVSLDYLIGRRFTIDQNDSKAVLKMSTLMRNLPIKKQVILYFKAQGWAEGTDDDELLEDL